MLTHRACASATVTFRLIFSKAKLALNHLILEKNALSVPNFDYFSNYDLYFGGIRAKFTKSIDGWLI